LIILVPAVLVVAMFVTAANILGAQLNLARLLAAGGGVIVAVSIVYLYRRRKVRPSRS
jgi:drug/metabolite transporter superfamily protein YnfA